MAGGRAEVRLGPRQATPGERGRHARLGQPLPGGAAGHGGLQRRLAKVFGVALNDIIVMIHCGSRGLGHQIATDYLAKMIKTAREEGIELPDKDLACAPINSDVGKQYYGAMCAGINCALANRQVLTHLAREAFADLFPRANLTLVYDVSHNTCKVEEHEIDGKRKKLYVHRKGATRAFGPGRPLAAGGSAGDRSARSDRRHDGHRLLHSRRHAGRYDVVLRLLLSRGRPGHEPQPGHQTLARQGHHHAPGPEGHPHQRRFAARHRRRGPGATRTSPQSSTPPKSPAWPRRSPASNR